MGKVRIKNQEHLEQIFRKYAENEGEEFSPDLIVEGNSELTFGELRETCEVIGYENLLLGDIFVDFPHSHCDTFYIDLIGIIGFRFGFGETRKEFFGGHIPDELVFENDGTLRIWFD